MKKIFLAAFAGTLLMTSCAGVNNAKTAQNNRAEYLKLKGNWELSSIDYDKNYKVKPFDDGADACCFVGSHWKLVPNNYSGSYTLNGGGDCPATTQPIKFEVVNGSEFKFKKIVDGTKAKQNLSGYSLHLANQTESQFSLEQNIPSGGEYVKIIYHFNKIN